MCVSEKASKRNFDPIRNRIPDYFMETSALRIV